MAEKSIIGIEWVKVGPCGVDGAMGLDLVTMGLLVPDSVKLSIPEPEKTDLFVENSSAPYLSIPKSQRDSSVEWLSRDTHPETLVKLFGGTVALDAWSAPTSEIPIEQSIKLASKSSGGYHYEIDIPRVLIRASLDGQLRATETAQVKVTGSILNPIDGTGSPLSPIKITKVTE
jgi:hypothetical protein